ncbi:MAG: sulfotransferase [Desulfobacteraceae bacterium]|nr:sulfotransferase [Desulfobacteraceae bacterium]
MNGKGPIFMCIGAQKAGTTWLYANLAKLPDVALPPLKEIHYFDEIYRKVNTSFFARVSAQEGMNKWWWKEKLNVSYRRVAKSKNIAHARWYLRYFFSPRNFNWYERLFKTPAGKISGDITPDYCILDKETIQFIHERYPQLKIIYLIRNPVDRAWSALKMRYMQRRAMHIGDINEKLVEDYYQEFHEFNDIERTIDNWTYHYPREQFYIGFYDELVEDPVTFLDNILIYLGVGRAFDHEKLRQKVFKGVAGKMPADIKLLLSRKSIDQIRFLKQYSSRFNVKYPEKWLVEAQRTIS